MKNYEYYRNLKVYSKEEIIRIKSKNKRKVVYNTYLDTIICDDGTLFKRINRDNYFQLNTRVLFGYEYVSITGTDKICKNYRLHRLIAKEFISNPNDYTVVGHKNNNKTDNKVENLYWTTVLENKRKAVADGLWKVVNRKKIVSLNIVTNEILYYNSVQEAHTKTQSGRTTIFRHLKKDFGRTKLRQNFRFAYLEDFERNGHKAFYL